MDAVEGRHQRSHDEVVDGLYLDERYFCRIGACQFWHTDIGQVKRHRNRVHRGGQQGFLCPNQTGTCISSGRSFARRDGVKLHCKKYQDCSAALAAKGSKIDAWGSFVTHRDLVPYDPDYHKPYRSSDGRRPPKGLQQ